MIDENKGLNVHEDIRLNYRGKHNVILAGNFRGRQAHDLPILLRGIDASKLNLAALTALGSQYVERTLVQPTETTFLTEYSPVL